MATADYRVMEAILAINSSANVSRKKDFDLEILSICNYD